MSALKLIEDHIDRTVSRVLSSWGVKAVSRVEGGCAMLPSQRAMLLAKLEFSGLAAGEYQLCCSTELAAALTKALLGQPEDDVGDEMACDTLRELVNVLTGCLLVSCYGDEVGFDLGLSQASSVTAPPERGEHEIRIVYSVFNRPLVVIFKRAEIIEGDCHERK
jgi:hypothetical protein